MPADGGDDVGKVIDGVIITPQMVDEGLDEIDALMGDGGGGGHHYSVSGLHEKRLPPGSHGVWAKLMPIMLYKLEWAVRRAGLSLHFTEFGMKSKPDKVSKLALAFEHGDVTLVDYALEV